MSDKLKEHTEFETKYRTSLDNLNQFKDIMEKQNPTEFRYVESDDIYYCSGDNKFLRHRFSDYKQYKLVELTFKEKHQDGNNWIREEVDLELDGNQESKVRRFCKFLGFNKNFRITKYCHIYSYKNFKTVFYTVKHKKDIEYFIELEIDKKFITVLTEDEAWDIIRAWEKVLEPLGIKAQNRMRLSLYELLRHLAEDMEDVKQSGEIQDENVQERTGS